jgi:hypothetical protein
MDMARARCRHGCIAYKGKVYVFGGGIQKERGFAHIADSEVFDPKKNSWKHISAMPVSSFDVTAVVAADNIYIVGHFIHSILRYSPMEDVYTIINPESYETFPKGLITNGESLFVLLGDESAELDLDGYRISTFTSSFNESCGSIDSSVLHMGRIYYTFRAPDGNKDFAIFDPVSKVEQTISGYFETPE